MANNLWLIAAFGVIHGINEWIDMFTLLQKPMEIIPLNITRMIIMPVSFLFLIYFGAKVISETKRKYSILQFLPIILLIPWATIIALSNQQLLMWGVWARYLLGAPGIFLTSYALFLQVPEFKKIKQFGVVNNLYTALISFACYGIFSGLVVPQAGFLPASVLNYTLFLDNIGIPVQVFRTLCAIVIAYSTIRILEIFNWETKTRIKSSLDDALNSKNELAKAKAYTDNIIKSMTDTLVVVDQDYKINFVNKATLDILEYAEDELVGKSVKAIFAEEGLTVNKMLDDINENGLLLSLETNYLTKDGGKIPILFSAITLHHSDSKIQGFLYVGSNISKLKQAEEKLRKVNRALKALSSCNKVLIHASDEPDLLQKICRTILEVGKYHLVWIGFTKPGEKNTICICPMSQRGYEEGYLKTANLMLEDTQGEFNPICTALRTNKPCIVRNIMTNPDYVPLRAEATKLGYSSLIALPLVKDNRTFGIFNVYAESPDAFDDREVKLLMELADDLVYGILSLRTHAERKQAEEALLESEETFKAISSTANDGIIMLNNEEEISYWNEAAGKMFDYSKEEAIGRKLHETIIPDRFEEDHLKGFRRFKETGQGPIIGKTVELTAIKKDGSEFPIELSLSAVKLKGKWNAVSIIRDITERKRIEKSVRVSYKMASLGQMTAGVFHEVLNPLNIISSYTQVMLLKEEKGSEKERYLKQILEEVERIVKITDSLLIFSRKGNENVESVEINSFLEKVMSIVEPDMTLRNIKFIRKFEEELPEIMANNDKLRQVFLNIITNVGHAMPNGGNLTISTLSIEKQGKSFVSIKLKDTGCGIKSSNIDKVFDPFFTTKKEGEGTGLGLSISYGIIKNHGGEMRVNSKEGKGTTFIIDLPAKT